MKKIKSSVVCAAAAVFSVILMLFSNATAVDSHAAANSCDVYKGSNVNNQNYIYNWARTIQSYLTKSASGGLMRVQGNAVDGKILVEYYDNSYNFLDTKLVNAELPIFGAFYETESNYFVLSGQENKSESNSAEVYRITKYDKNWNRIGSCGLFGANTYIPFDAGSARIDHSGKYLIIRTCHEMYMSSDGLHHQANVTIQVDMNTMTVTDSFTDIMNVSLGYVSHSFNQFIRLEENHIVAVDHGDAYPRSIVLIKYPTDFTTGKFTPDWRNTCTAIDLVKFPGSIGDNVTGATIGGFEVSSSAYIVAGSYTGDDKYKTSGAVKNIFVSTLSKNSSTPRMNWITNYTSGTVSTPHLVKLSSDSYLLMWSYNDSVYYTRLDGNGNKTGSIYSMTGALSDCIPLLYNGRMVWYTWKNETMTFYSINTSDLSSHSETVIVKGHDFETTNSAGSSKATQKCKKCGLTQTITVPAKFNAWWRENADSGSYWSRCSSKYHTGDTLDLWITFDEVFDNDEMVFELSDSSVASIGHTDSSNTIRINMNKLGSFSLKVYPKYNTSAAKTYDFTVQHNYTSSVTKEATCNETGLKTNTCSVCGDKNTETIQKLSHNYSAAWTTDKAATCKEEGSRSHHCLNCGDKKDVTAIPKTDHTYTSKVTKAATCTDTGTETLTCSVCGTAKTQTISAAGHRFGAYKITVPPTLETEGTEERSCSECGAIEQRTVARLTNASSSGADGSDDNSSSADSNSSDNNSSDGSGDNVPSENNEVSSSSMGNGSSDTGSLPETSDTDASADDKKDPAPPSVSSGSSTAAPDDSAETEPSDGGSAKPSDNQNSDNSNSKTDNNSSDMNSGGIVSTILIGAGVLAVCSAIIAAVVRSKKKK